MDSAQENSVDGERDDREFRQALAQIVVAFVDVGFGISATSMSLKAANENRPIKALVERLVEDEA